MLPFGNTMLPTRNAMGLPRRQVAAHRVVLRRARSQATWRLAWKGQKEMAQGVPLRQNTAGRTITHVDSRHMVLPIVNMRLSGWQIDA